MTVLYAACAGDGAPDASQPSLDHLQIRLSRADDPGLVSVEVTGLPASAVAALGAAEWDRRAWSDLLRVTVAFDEGQASDEMSAVIGEYSVDETVVRFTPMFPFDPGRRYAVRFTPSRLPGADAWPDTSPIVSVVALEGAVRAPTTVVRHVYPTSDELPENQLKLYIHFSSPMSRVDGLEYVHLLDQAGREVDAAFLPLGMNFWDRDFRRYTVFFDPGRVKQGIRPNAELGRSLAAGGQYTLVVDADWPDAEGNPLRDPFERTFTVGRADEEPLNTATWMLRAPSAGTRAPFVVEFPEPLDHGVMTRALAVEDAGGRTVEGEAEISRAETQWTFTPRQPWASGEYALLALGILEDLAGNRIGVPFEIDVFEQIDEPDEQESYRVPFEVP